MIKILSAGFVSVCLVCFVLTGCGEKSSSDKKKETVVRQKIPETQAQPENTQQTTQKATAPADAQKDARADAPAAAAKDQPVGAAGQQPATTDKESAATAKSSGEEGSAETAAAEGGQKKDEQSLTAASAEQAEAGEKTDSSGQTEPPAAEEQAPEAMEAEINKVEAEASTMAEAVQTDPEQPAPIIDLEEVEPPVKEGEEAATEEEKFYNPFAPLFKREKAEAVDLGGGGAREKRKVLTPLEKIGLGQLQLVGVIMAKSGNRAIVTDASGKGYVVKKGTYIGLNSGVVESIESDRIVVAEDLGGVTNKTVLKLQKPAGE